MSATDAPGDGLARPGALLDLAERVLELVPARAEAQVVAVWRAHGLTRFAGSRIHQNLETQGLAISVKVALDGRVAAASTSGTDRAALAEVVERATRAAAVRPVDPGWPGVAGPDGPGLAGPGGPTPRPQPGDTDGAGWPGADHWDDPTAAATPDQRAALVAAFLGQGSDGSDGAGYCDTLALAQAVATSGGRRAAGRATRATLDGIFLRAPEGGHTPAGSGHATSARLADLEGAEVGRRAAGLCRASVGAVDRPPAEYPVVLGPECVAELAAFLADGSSAKAVQEGRSHVDPGRQAFDESFGLVDDMAAPGACGLAIDTDGEARRRVELVAGGRCGGLLHDRRTAARQGAGATSTGHAHLASDSWGPAPAALQVLVGGGAARKPTTEELVGELDRGLVVTCFNYCRVLDPKTVEVTGLTRNGTFWVEGGEVVRAVTNLRFTQSFVEALAPGRLLGWAPDDRLADCERGPGLVQAPSLHLSGWRFTGGAAG